MGVRVSEKKVLRRVFGSKSQNVTEWRKLHSKKLYTLYSSSDIGND
jgi:hypothetical protein